jgi:hypothetical protein
MPARFFRAILPLFAVAMLGVLACDLSTLGIAQAAKPKTTIQSPATGAQFREGDDVTVQSISTDPVGVVRVELLVDGAVVRADAPPIAAGQTSFTLAQKWKALAGTHTLSVRAFNASGGASEFALVTITVVAAVVEVPTIPIILPTVPAPLGSLPTPLPTVPPSGATPTLAATTTRTPTRPSASPTIVAPPGFWAITITLDPPAPKRGTFVTFNVTFMNATGTSQTYRWFVKIYEPDKRNSFGETSKLTTTFQPGTTTLAAPADWKIGAVGDCQPYIARVFWEDFNSKVVTEFIKPDQSGGPAASFQECP